MKYEIAIRVDTNDADYLTETSEIDSDELQTIRPLIEAIQQWTQDNRDNWDGHNYATGECRREDLGEKSPRELYDFPEEVFELFEDFCPCPEHGFHTMESITITPAVEKIKLL